MAGSSRCAIHASKAWKRSNSYFVGVMYECGTTGTVNSAPEFDGDLAVFPLVDLQGVTRVILVGRWAPGFVLWLTPAELHGDCGTVRPNFRISLWPFVLARTRKQGVGIRHFCASKGVGWCFRSREELVVAAMLHSVRFLLCWRMLLRNATKVDVGMMCDQSWHCVQRMQLYDSIHSTQINTRHSMQATLTM